MTLELRKLLSGEGAAIHPERVMDNSKSSTSEMIVVTGDGKLLPPFIVYKAQYLYPTWIERSVPGSRYASNKSGWFDMNLFEEWFVKSCLPAIKDKEGRKAVSGDN